MICPVNNSYAEADASLLLQLPQARRTLYVHETFRRVFHRALLRRFLDRIQGRRCGLVSLEDMLEHNLVQGCCHVGLVSVLIEKIVGSEGRCCDFDARFRPLKDHGCQRWHRICEARLIGHTLPPVELIQIGEGYFCRDGHHRISVAAALGHCAIDAMVVRWEIAPRVLHDTQAWPAQVTGERAA